MMAKKLAVKNAIPAETSATPSDLKNVFTGLNAIGFDSTEQNTTGSNVLRPSEQKSPAISAGLHLQLQLLLSRVRLFGFRFLGVCFLRALRGRLFNLRHCG